MEEVMSTPYDPVEPSPFEYLEHQLAENQLVAADELIQTTLLALNQANEPQLELFK
jgi:hypothetical protein